MRIAIQMALRNPCAKLGSRLFSGLTYGFESCHEIRDDLNHQQERDQRRVRKQRGEVVRRPLAHAECDKNYKQRESAEGRPVLKGRAEADAAIVQHGEQRGEGKADGEVRKIYGTSGDAIEFERIERWKDVAGDAADGHGLPRADNEVGEHHHPSGGEADGARKSCGGVGDLARGVGHCGDQPAVNPTDGEQQRPADGEAEKGTESAATQEPIIHDDEPADADHGAPAQREVVSEPEFAGEMGHGHESSASSANYKARLPSGAEARILFGPLAARLKPRPFKAERFRVLSKRSASKAEMRGLHGSIDLPSDDAAGCKFERIFRCASFVCSDVVCSDVLKTDDTFHQLAKTRAQRHALDWKTAPRQLRGRAR
jgi:hypothetical protein